MLSNVVVTQSSVHDNTFDHLAKKVQYNSIWNVIIESLYVRDAIFRFVEWCQQNNLLINTVKSKEVVLDFCRAPPPHPPAAHHH